MDKEKELKRLGKQELIHRILSDEEKIEVLNNRVRELEMQIREAMERQQNQRIDLEEAGSVAEASLRLTDVFREAQKAADIYLMNIQDMEERGKAEFEQKVQEASDEARRILVEAEKEGRKLRRQAELEASRREHEADKYYETIRERTRSALVNLSRFNEDYENLKKIADNQPSESLLIMTNDDRNVESEVDNGKGEIDARKLYQSVDSLVENDQGIEETVA